MTVINTKLNNIFATLDGLVLNATAERDAAIATANADFAAAEAKAKGEFDKALAEEAKTFFANGGTLDEFAEAYGKSTVTTRNHLKALDVEVPVGKKGAKSKYSDAEKLDIATAWKKGDRKTRLTLALEKDVTEATMRNWAIELGVFEPVKREAKADA